MDELRSFVETLRDFVDKASHLGIDYMVTGSFAMCAYGEIRLTRDVDIVIQMDERKVAAFANAFTGTYYVSDNSIRRAIANRSMFNVVDTKFGTKIDCIVQKNTAFARQSFERRRLTTVLGVEFWTTTKEDLILAKLDWARDSHSEMQIRDVANLTYTDYDAQYVDEWINRMALDEIWSDVTKWKIQHERSEN